MLELPLVVLLQPHRGRFVIGELKPLLPVSDQKSLLWKLLTYWALQNEWQGIRVLFCYGIKQIILVGCLVWYKTGCPTNGEQHGG